MGPRGNYKGMNPADRLKKRREKRRERNHDAAALKALTDDNSHPSTIENDEITDEHISKLLMRNEDELLNFVAQVNKVYQEKLKRPAPFMTFVICGMQSTGKSTIMERFMNAVLNIIQEGTGTRCPLDTTCIHDDSRMEPECELSGSELHEDSKGEHLTMNQVFERITAHNKMLGNNDQFSTEPLHLVFRSKNVQNMRFVDTPGIISNKSTGKDNRKDIEEILRSAMSKPNTKLCVLLEPTEFATNPIIEFCDKTFVKREKWINNATFLMTKFDKQLEDSRTGSKANNFFKEFHANKCIPHLVITPTLAKEDLPTDELFKQRKKLLESADREEHAKFDSWLEGHRLFLQNDPGDALLDSKSMKKIGFTSARTVMREIMLEDTAKRLPEVLSSLREELVKCTKEEKVLLEKDKLNDPGELKAIVTRALSIIQKRIENYLDGDIESSRKFPDRLQNLEEEIVEEEKSDWSSRELNHYNDAEEDWRDQISRLEEYPEEIQAESKFLGGKQVHRAIEFFRVVMTDSLPDPYELKDVVANGTGYLCGGPGINYLIKHVGSIFRGLFSLALDDVKQGEKFSSTFQLIPTKVEKYLIGEFDNMLWSLMKTAADKTHCSLEPMYSTVDPNLPTFVTSDIDAEENPTTKYVIRGGTYVQVKSQDENEHESLIESFKSKLNAFRGDSDEAKKYLKSENALRANRRKSFLPNERTTMITSNESEKILRRSFEYIVALMEFNLVTLKFQINHYLIIGFKEELSYTFTSKICDGVDWNTLVETDPYVKNRLKELKEQIEGLKDSLQEVKRIQR